MSDKTEDSLTALIEQEWVDRAIIDFRDALDLLCEECQSPIERVFLRALYLEKPEAFSFSRSLGRDPYDFYDLLCGEAPKSAAEWIGIVYTQMILGPYRADFYIEAFERENGKKWFAAAIECDGHDFHEKTKDQVRRDKRRDRWFQTRGIQVIRFAGSEIWNDPIKCAEEAFEVFWSASRRHTFS